MELLKIKNTNSKQTDKGNWPTIKSNGGTFFVAADNETFDKDDHGLGAYEPKLSDAEP